ncbi:T9SS type A sorting domain-containing protein [Crocinitomicaceae bacterium]|nr:T9SS type A sorting domain-containing protein [Crocinitomicaceae bacterium]MDB2408445.1 T9SS type A sorting domain-containing protein [Crocinitomicaceae bacterium]
MNKLFKLSVYICIILPFNAFNQSQAPIVWEDTISVADGSIYGNTRPRIVLNSQDEPVVVFGRNIDGSIHTAKYNGLDFDPPVQITPNDFQSYLANWTGPEIDASGDTIMIVFKENPIQEGHVYSVRSTDGGNSFSDPLRTDSHPVGVAWLPNIAFDNNGNPSVIYMVHDQVWLNPRFVVSHSNDGGITFNPEQEVTSIVPDEACDCCPATIAKQDNLQALVFRNNEGSIRDMFAVKSQDGGQSFSEYENIDYLNWMINQCPSTGPDAFIDESNLFVVSASQASGRYRCYISKTDMINTQSPEMGFMLPAPESSVGNANFPRIHGNHDSLFVVWQAAETSNYEVFCAFASGDDFNSFEQTKSQVNLVNSGTQSNPDLYYRNGYVHVVFQDGNTGNVVYRRGRISMAGLSENPAKDILIYPNPTSNEIHIKGINEPTNFTITSNDGKQVMSGIVSENKSSISVQEIPLGNYIITLNKKNYTFEKQ